MARARLIKHSFFKNEILATLPFEARLLFAGLWGIADREGRLEDRPRRIKADVFPYDDVDVDALLSRLEETHFIRRYQAQGDRFIAVLKFRTHQHPHIKEPKSTIPAPDKHQTSTRQELIQHSFGPAVIDPVIDPVTSNGNNNKLLSKNQLIRDATPRAIEKAALKDSVTQAVAGFHNDTMRKRGVDLNPELTKAAREQEAEESRTKGRRFR